MVLTARTDQSGEFCFVDVPPGLKQLEMKGATQLIRIWPAHQAPPKATRRLLLVAGTETVRAQGVPPATMPVGHHGRSGQEVLYRILQRPWFVAAGTATAISLPIVLGDDDDGDRDFTGQITQPDAS